MRVKKLVKLINNERNNRRIVSDMAQGCTIQSMDSCSYTDNARCTVNSYDVCTKDYAGCYNYSYDYCDNLDVTACGNQTHDLT